MVRLKDDSFNQNLGIASRQFLRCGLPAKRPEKGKLQNERHNDHFQLQVTGHPAHASSVLNQQNTWKTKRGSTLVLPISDSLVKHLRAFQMQPKTAPSPHECRGGRK